MKLFKIYKYFFVFIAVSLGACSVDLEIKDDSVLPVVSSENKPQLMCITATDKCFVKKPTMGASCRCPSKVRREKSGYVDKHDIFSGQLAMFVIVRPLKIEYDIETVYFGTNRNYKSDAESYNDKFGVKRGEFRYGKSYISIPKNHKEGVIERPRDLVVYKQSEDASKHIVIKDMSIINKFQFFNELSSNDDKSVIVFIHGYNVTHAEALRRSAQLKHDLKNFKGSVIAYTWPSNGVKSKYTFDETNIQWAEPSLKKFLVDIKENINPTKFHVIAHSMGNRAFIRVLNELSRGYDEPIFNQIVLGHLGSSLYCFCVT